MESRAHPFSHDRSFIPTIVWFETDYSVYTMRQASRRSWRIGQTQPLNPLQPVTPGELAPRNISAYSVEVPTLLHISDLHRTSGPRVRNDELLAAMASDAKRWDLESIPRPDLIVVSGDLVQGVAVDTDDPDAEIVAQYAEAGDLLHRLAAQFVESDRSRVIFVPGNHDVHWARARSAMTPLPDPPKGLAREALRADSKIRWNWEDQRAYSITDPVEYESRYDHFRQFRADFYASLHPDPVVNIDTDVVFAEYPSLGLAVVGFASWYGNDCFCHVGEIDPAAVAASQKLRSDSTAQVAVALWHHGIQGGPRAQDYMDRHVIHRLIDFGFSIGLHGHQHYPGAAPYELHLPNRTSMAVVGAGSLAVGDRQLPPGERRQFNIVDIDAAEKTITVHVREMSSEGVFTGSYRSDLGGKTSITLDLPVSDAGRPGPTATQLLDEAMTAARSEQFERAWELLPRIIDSSHSHAKRQVTIEVLHGLGCHDELLRLLNPPQNADEAVRAISVLVEAERYDDATAILHAASNLLDAATNKALADQIAVRRTFS